MFIVAQRLNETSSGCILHWWNQGMEGHRSSSNWTNSIVSFITLNTINLSMHIYFKQNKWKDELISKQWLGWIQPLTCTLWWCRLTGLIGNPKVWVVQWCRMCGGAGCVGVQDVWWCRMIFKCPWHAVVLHNISQLPTKMFLLTKTCYSLSHLKDE